MEDKELDKLFRESIRDLNGVPPGTSFNKERAWGKVEKGMQPAQTAAFGRKWWAIAAAIVLLIAVSILLLNKGTEDTPSENGYAKKENAPVLPVDSLKNSQFANAPIEKVDSQNILPKEAPTPISEKPQIAEKVAPKRVSPRKEIAQKPAIEQLAVAPSPDPDTALKHKKPLVKVRVILAEEKPDKESILRAEWEKQSKWRLRLGDMRADRIRASFGDDYQPGFAPGSSFRKSWDIDSINPQSPKQ